MTSFQSTLPTRGSDYGMIYNLSFVINVSIHAPHEGERHAETDAVLRLIDVSIHAPHEGERR